MTGIVAIFRKNKIDEGPHVIVQLISGSLLARRDWRAVNMGMGTGTVPLVPHDPTLNVLARKGLQTWYPLVEMKLAQSHSFGRSTKHNLDLGKHFRSSFTKWRNGS